MTQREQLEAILSNPNVQRYLAMLSQAEGTAKYNDPYRVGFGGQAIADLSQHPNVAVPFTQTNGQRNTTTAAGKYQFLNRTWQDVANTLGLQDFSAKNQDLGALELMRRSGSLPDVLRGDFASAVARDGRTWASLPSSPYTQPKRSTEFINQALGNTTAAPQAMPWYLPQSTEEDLSHALAAYGSSDEMVPEESAAPTTTFAPNENNLPAAYRGQPYSINTAQPNLMPNNYASWVENYIRELVDHV